MIKTKYHKNLTLFLVVLFLTSSSVASLDIRNYDNDPDLAAALTNRIKTPHKTKMVRWREKYYLEYLKKDIPSFQKARVYLRLGSLFTVESNPKNGIMPDNKKGDRYLEKVLEVEPERIDTATIRARTLLASSPMLSRKESFQKRLDVYEWLSSLTEEKCKKLWLPLEPDQEAILPITFKRLQNYVPKVKHVQAVNALALAVWMPDYEARLKEIIERFPGKEIAHMAWHLQQFQSREVRQKVMRILAEYSPRHALASEGVTTSENPEPHAGGMREEESTPSVKSSEQRSNEVRVLADSPPIGDSTHTVWRVYALIICAFLLGSLLIYVARRGKHPERNNES